MKDLLVWTSEKQMTSSTKKYKNLRGNGCIKGNRKGGGKG